jgi:E3 ubiquitin-protein ligase HERC2
MYRTEKATVGLARIGSRAALHLSFAFMRRAWRSGEDAELCTELLRESLEALQDLPEATLFEGQAISPVWLEVVERSSIFLREVVSGYVPHPRNMQLKKIPFPVISSDLCHKPTKNLL